MAGNMRAHVLRPLLSSVCSTYYIYIYLHTYNYVDYIYIHNSVYSTYYTTTSRPERGTTTTGAEAVDDGVDVDVRALAIRRRRV